MNIVYTNTTFSSVGEIYRGHQQNEIAPQGPPPLRPPTLEERLDNLEKIMKCRCDALGQEVNIVLAEVNIITDWITKFFEVEIIDKKKSSLLKSIHDGLNQVDGLIKSLSLLHTIKFPTRPQPSTETPVVDGEGNSSNDNVAETQIWKGLPPPPPPPPPKPKGKLGRPRGSGNKSKKKPTPSSKPKSLVFKRRGRRKTQIRNKYAPAATYFKGPFGTLVEKSEDIDAENTSLMTVLVDIKDEPEELQDNVMVMSPSSPVSPPDSFENGYVPNDMSEDERDDYVNNSDSDDNTFKETKKVECQRPKRSTTKNVSYDGLMESNEEDDEEVPPPAVQKRRQGKLKKSKIAEDEKDADYRQEEDNFATDNDNDQNDEGVPEEIKQPKKRGRRPNLTDSGEVSRSKILANTPLMCDECGKVVKGPWALKTHKETHSNVRQFTCHICGFAFKRKPHLMSHILLHEGVKNLKCQYCGRGFYLRRDLLRHERTHTGEKPYKCTWDNCSKGFNVKQHLTNHIRTQHKQLKPYKCPYCEKSYGTANTLRLHKKTHLENKSVTCPKKRGRQAKQKDERDEDTTNLPDHNSHNENLGLSKNQHLPPSLGSGLDISQNNPQNAYPQMQSTNTNSHNIPSQPNLLPFPSQETSTSIGQQNLIPSTWRQNPSDSSLTNVQHPAAASAASLFLQNIYDPTLNMHYGNNYPPNNSKH